MGTDLIEAVQQCASAVVSVLEGGHHHGVLEQVMAADRSDPVWVGAVRVLGADVLAPHALMGQTPSADDLAMAWAALTGFAPGRQASVSVLWTYWGLREALRAVGSGELNTAAQPDTDWVSAVEWPVLAHRLAQIASLAVPGRDCALASAVSNRVADVARGFARAVRRRDWWQAAGVGRWLVLSGGGPPSLGLEAGLDYIECLGVDDARVALQVRAARLILKAGV